MEVAIPRPGGMDFDFNEARPMAYLSAPSTPKRFGGYSSSFLSAPSSPSQVPELYSYFEDLSMEKEGKEEDEEEEEFAFDFGNASPLSTADELFHGGKIKPSRPHPGLKLELRRDDSLRSPLLSPRPSSPRSPIARGKMIIKEVFSPRGEGAERGRERVSGPGRSSTRRGSRSLSPCRVSGYPWEEPALDSKTSVSSSSSSSSKSSSRKWKLKDLLLFRSASEGRSSDKDPLRKYSAVTLFRTRKPQNDQDAKNSRRKATASAHELHYTTNKAASDDLKKKTFLPYRYGLLGRLAFNPAVHSLSK